MRRLDIHRFSTQYRGRLLQEADIPSIYALCIGNAQYYAFCGKEPSHALIQQDLTLLPPNKTLDEKYDVGFFDGNMLIAVLDLIDGYPTADTAFIGFFMLNIAEQGHGLGSSMIDALCTYLKDTGFHAVRLGIDRENPQSMHFWKKNGFLPLYEVRQDAGTIVVAERRLNEYPVTETEETI